MKLSCTYDNAPSAQERLEALRKQDRIAWINNTPDGKSHVFWLAGLDIGVSSERSSLFPHLPQPLLEHQSA